MKMSNLSKKRIAVIVVVVIVLAAIITPVAYFTTRQHKRQKHLPVSYTEMLKKSSTNCFPEADGGIVKMTKESCEKRHCVYYTGTGSEKDACVFPARKDFGFSVVGDKRLKETSPGVYRVQLKSKGSSPFDSPAFKNPVFEVEMKEKNVIRFKFDDIGTNRYKVPMQLNLATKKSVSRSYDLSITDWENFAFVITRRSTGTVLFNTSVGGLTLSDQFLQLSTSLPSNNIYGFGENLHHSFRHDLNYRTWPMFSRDQPPRHKLNANLYGVHPFYTCVEHDGNTHGVLLLNSNAQDYSFTPLPMLTYRTIGGILDYYMFLGPTPENVIQQYTKAIGRPFMPPYWSLGFSLSRYGYNSLANMEAAISRTEKHGIPQDVQYADIDHMDKSMDFTIDITNFGGLSQKFTELRKTGMRTVIMLDPCFISNVTGYEPYDELSKIRGAIMWPDGHGVLGVAAGKNCFPDFFKTETKSLWKTLIKKHREKLVFDGLWIDMNEPANFGTNQPRPFNWDENVKPYWSLKCPMDNTWDNPPYRTTWFDFTSFPPVLLPFRGGGLRTPKILMAVLAGSTISVAAYVHDSDNKVQSQISNKTLCMVARQGDDNKKLHYDVHSLFGWSQSEPTIQALREASGERSMVLSRSTFPGSGQFVGHWLGDNDSDWPDLADSIIGMLEFNLFGIPFIGADICGFFGNTTEELCKRWSQLGAFYPFSRNHNGIGYIDQDPGALGEDVARAAREALETRYWLLPYLYTLFHNAHVYGETVVRPLHHEFPTDTTALVTDRQFLWGRSLLISPILEKNQTVLNYYLPDGRWYDYYTGIKTAGPAPFKKTVNGSTPIVLHIRGGSIIPMQEPARNVTYSRKNPMKLLIALNNSGINGGKAEGSLFWDDGVSKDTYEKGLYSLYTFQVEDMQLKMEIRNQHTATAKDLIINTVEIHGVTDTVSDVILDQNGVFKPVPSVYFPSKETLLVRNLTITLTEEFTLGWGGRGRIDCYPERLSPVKTLTKEACENRNCLYCPSENDSPDCFYPTSNYGYSAGKTINTDLGWAVNLTWKGLAPFKDPIKIVTFSVEMLDNHLLRFQLDDPNALRYKVPLKLNLPKSRASDPRYDVIITNRDPFYFQIIRRSTRTILWDSSVGGLTFQDQFLQIATKLPSKNIYGFGENVHGSLRHDLHWKTWPMFARDQPTGGQNQQNHYGVHPYYMCMENDGHSHGVLLLNSNAQEYSLTPLPMLVYRTIGGIFDFYMFLGPEPENVVQQYTEVIGRPYMPPYWSLGFQLCRYGYNKLENLKAAVERTKKAEIPHDVQYADIDHMDRQRIFTVDPVNFAGLADYFHQLRSEGMSTIIILDPCLAANDTYDAYLEMKNGEANIKWPSNYKAPSGSVGDNNTVLGYVWPSEKVVFPDFFKSSARETWKKLIIKHFKKKVQFDGLWIDMNEPANFGTNEDKPWNWPVNKTAWSLKCNIGKYEDPPYRTMATFQYDSNSAVKRISDKTICMDARQGQNEEYMHYDVHSLYGWKQTLPTLQGLRNVTGKRGIVISRSTFPGSGKYAGHWLGDNSANWDNMRLSIIGMLEFNMFGIPYIGADVCGFFDNTTAELCKRWMQLGAFNTFFRNHNGKNYIPQDPASFNAEVTKVSRVAVETRYWLLPYLYTLFHHAHVRGNTVIRPLHHEFPYDSNTYKIDRQFLWGQALLISPILTSNAASLSLYIPDGTWYDFYSGNKTVSENGKHINIPVVSDSHIPLHIRGGNIIPMQKPANNTKYSRKNEMVLKIALQSDGTRTSATGDLFWDDGDSVDTYENGHYHFVTFRCTDRSLKMNVHHNYQKVSSDILINEIHVLGLKNDIDISFIYVNESTKHDDFTYYESNSSLVLSQLGLSLSNSFTVEWTNLNKDSAADFDRIDCYPDINAADDTDTMRRNCIARGCSWDKSIGYKIPSCYINNTVYGYSMKGNTKTVQNPENVTLSWKNISSMFQGDISQVQLQVIPMSENVLRVKFIDPLKHRYEVPVPLNLHLNRKQSHNNYIVEVGNDRNNMFYMKLKRNGTQNVIWDTSIGGFTYSNQFLQLATKLPSKNMYGFGENRHFTFKHDFNFHTWPLFSRDNGVNWGDYANLYGVHPFYMNVEDKSGNAHAVLLLNSNAMEIVLQPSPAITYRTTGGILDFYIFLGPDPESVIQQYTSVIGNPYLPPYWALGFQLSRYGYNNLETMQAAVHRTRSADIPIDVQYADIDHMDERMDFTWDSVRFSGLPEFIKELQDNGIRYIIIIDPALISNVTDYHPYVKGVEKDIFIKWPRGKNPESNQTGDYMLGYVWPKGKVVFPDFLKPETREYWKDLIVNHHMNISFDGLWIDMNEPANFGTNEDKPFNWPSDVKPYWSLKCPKSQLDDPPYKPKSIFGPRLSDKTLCMVAEQKNGNYKHYDVHSLYGWSETEPTLNGLRHATNKRGIVISRSTYPSSGKYTGHWLGDNDSKWPNLHDSVIGIMEFNLFGIPYIGADICGFFGDSTAEMCQRWMQLGAFYTFSRNHNTINQKPQDPAYFGPAVADSSRRVLRIRYTLLPYLYTLFYHAHAKGGTVIRSLLQNFPSDEEALNIDSQFMWGSGFMISPVLEKGKTVVDVYFPHGVWYDYYTGAKMKSGEWELINAPRDHIPLYVKGGHIIPTQTPANTTKYSRRNPLGLIVALDENDQAFGNLFWDDGESIDTVSNGNYYYSTFNFSSNKIEMNVEHNKISPSVNILYFQKIVLYGMKCNPKHVKADSQSITSYKYSEATQILFVTGLNLTLVDSFSVSLGCDA